MIGTTGVKEVKTLGQVSLLKLMLMRMQNVAYCVQGPPAVEFKNVKLDYTTYLTVTVKGNNSKCCLFAT